MNVLWLIAIVLLVMAGTNLLSTLLTTNREGSRRVGVQLALGFTPHQIKTQGAISGAALGLLATVIGVPLGLWVFRVLSDVVSTSIGVGPGWMPAPPGGAVVFLTVAAWAVSATFGAVVAGRMTRRPASELVRGD
jgi:putative ABC transport system permease protein